MAYFSYSLINGCKTVWKFNFPGPLLEIFRKYHSNLTTARRL